GEWPGDRDQVALRDSKDAASDQLAACLHLVEETIRVGLRELHARRKLRRRWGAAVLGPGPEDPVEDRVAQTFGLPSVVHDDVAVSPVDRTPHGLGGARAVAAAMLRCPRRFAPRGA